jgi:aryl-alcohol dehydrogenase-like predicted oxidoreductase
MNFCGFYGKTDTETSFRCLDAALDNGVTFLDTAEVYGQYKSEELLGNYMAQSGNTFKLATKAGIRWEGGRGFDNSRDYLRSALEGSLKRLGRDHVDLYYLHRKKDDHPIEDVAETMAEFIKEGKIGGYGLSEVAPSTLRRAHAVHPVSAVQSEYSLWTRLPEMGMLQTCAELGTTFVAFSPLARGMCGEGFPDLSLLPEGSFLHNNPRFASPNFEANCAAFVPFKEFVRSRGWPVPAAALAWALDRAKHIAVIPGTRTAEHLTDWVDACDIRFTDADRAEIERLLPVGFAHGDRYSVAQNVGPERYC